MVPLAGGAAPVQLAMTPSRCRRPGLLPCVLIGPLPCVLIRPADNWFLQRLRNRSFVVALLACGAAAAALVATTAAVTVLAMRWRQRAAARRRKRAGAGAEESAELMRLREAP